ncbi:hypothetical protein LWI29_038403 [Acer saccharum]|uniref:Apple domain-containing protein n=1 Tax=Acer saccharum TaxID=4024 RepID=A0AA39W5B7_ACESA|nr:hypothetical protein LWI29_038403 [Acer saccharum]
MGSKVQYRSGSWNGLRWTGTPYLKTNPVYTYEFVSNETDVFYTFDIQDRSVPSKVVLSSSGDVLRLEWKDSTQTWRRFPTTPLDRCEIYDVCGSYASCNINKSPDVCECLKGFTPKSPGEGKIPDWTEGCVRRAPLHCNHSNGFLKHREVKLPNTSHSWVDNNISLAECEKLCLSNCTCTAFANSDVREGGTGCLLWFSDLLDIRNLATNGQDLYVRVAASELGTEKKRAWKLWNEERAVELIDQQLDHSSSSSEILRCIHVGLLCVQQGPEDRPNMSTVALMLGGEGSLPQPRQPGGLEPFIRNGKVGDTMVSSCPPVARRKNKNFSTSRTHQMKTRNGACGLDFIAFNDVLVDQIAGGKDIVKGS